MKYPLHSKVIYLLKNIFPKALLMVDVYLGASMARRGSMASLSFLILMEILPLVISNCELLASSSFLCPDDTDHHLLVPQSTTEPRNTRTWSSSFYQRGANIFQLTLNFMDLISQIKMVAVMITRMIIVRIKQLVFYSI